MFKECLNVSTLWLCFTLVHSIPSVSLPYPFTSYPPIFQQLSVHILISSTLVFLKSTNAESIAVVLEVLEFFKVKNDYS
jgi:hypothetical protein